MSTQVATVTEAPRRSVLIDMATRFGMEPAPFEATLRATVVPKDCSKEQFAAFLLVAREYELNPLTKEIYAFPTRAGGIQPIVSIDGWANLINSHPSLDGIEFDDHLDKDGANLTAITARIWRKDRTKPIVVTEYMAECKRATDPWKQWPRRMLRHKALIQCARYAFGFAGIVDPDEAERMADVSPMRDVTPALEPPDPGEIVAESESREIWDDAEPEAGNLVRGQLTESAWLADLTTSFSRCDDLTELAEVQMAEMAPRKGEVSTQAWKDAEALVQKAVKRINDASQTMLDAG